MLIATLIAISILPLIYAGLYLWAFWDPYGKMENLPVAIVNEDECAYRLEQNDKKQYCFGNDLVDNLKKEKGMNWQFVDRKTALTGLQNRKYYTMALIPKDFSQNILSVDGDHPQKALIEFKSRQASNFMASKFTETAFIKIKAALNEKISKKYFDNIFSETRDNLKDLQKAVDGVSDLKDGLKTAKDGSEDLYQGINKASDGLSDLKNGLKDLYDGSVRLNNGTNDISNGVDKLLNGANSLDKALLDLSNGINQMLTATDTLTAGQDIVVTNINAYLQTHPDASSSAELITALGAATQVNNGITQLKNGLNAASTGSQQLIGGSGAIKNGLSSLSIGCNNLATGSASLKDGLTRAKDGANELFDGIEKIKNGQKDLGKGLADAYNGTKELKDKLSEAVNKSLARTDENKNKLQEEVLAAPVDIHDVSIDIVANNGTGFAPYFISLALWVGGMAIFFLVDLNFKKNSKIKEFWPKLWISLIIAIVQASILNLVLIKLLGLKVNHSLSYIIFTLLLATCFMLIQMFLTLSFGLAGKFLGITLLMLQLTSSAGSYPLETVPSFFQKINPFLPMTYAVSGLREVISGGNYKIINNDIKVIIIYSLVSMLVIGLNLIKKFNILLVINKKVRKKK